MNIIELKRQSWPLRGYRGLFDCDCACADYSGVADASVEANKVMAELGREQLAEARRQFEVNQSKLTPIVDAQIRNMDLAYEQGQGNYDRMKTDGWGLQDQMRVIAEGGETTAQRAQMDKASGDAMADVSSQLDLQRAQSQRAMTRMGVNPMSAKMRNTGGDDVMAASAKVAAGNQASAQAGDRYYARLGDTYNTYAGLGSQAPTFYSAGTNAGNSAVGNQMGMGAQLIQGLGAGASTIGQGAQLGINGLLGAANGEQSGYNNMQGGGLGELGTLLGGAASAYKAFSDRRLKQDIEAAGEDAKTGLPLYEFAYKAEPGRRFVGVMADDVRKHFPEAVVQTDEGYDVVNYGMLGIELQEVL